MRKENRKESHHFEGPPKKRHPHVERQRHSRKHPEVLQKPPVGGYLQQPAWLKVPTVGSFGFSFAPELQPSYPRTCQNRGSSKICLPFAFHEPRVPLVSLPLASDALAFLAAAA